MNTEKNTTTSVQNILENSLKSLEEVLSDQNIEQQVQEIMEGPRWKRNERIARLTQQIEQKWERSKINNRFRSQAIPFYSEN